ncbi:hypothetical protein F5I97DRAFT_1939714 [Phlebopus sp. FC_14]|nr:hypothetical protein F5I97DRAFT_1939714 [Phlebopus sp. FC_14]
MQIYDTLPPEAQQVLVQKQLAPLLNTIPKEKLRKVSSSATRMQSRYTTMPVLNLKAKKAEICSLLAELSRDAKRSFVKERSRKEELLSEVVDSLTRWLNDVWKVVYEFRTNYKLAHACLLFASDTLEQIANVCGICKCSYANMPIPVKIRRTSGALVKSFLLTGAHNLERVMLWIWRDLFVTLLATGTKRQRNSISDMLDDIQTLLGWRSLEYLLYGGRKSMFDEDEDDDDYDGEEAENGVDVFEEDDGDEDYTDDDSCYSIRDRYPSAYYASHWSEKIGDQQAYLKYLVHKALLGLFKLAPSAPLYACMAAIADDEDEVEDELHPIILSMAGHSSENFNAALRLLALSNDCESLHNLLSSHRHLLRPQDTSALQFAVLILASDFLFRTEALAIIQEELTDTADTLRAAVRANFSSVDSAVNRAELRQILGLRSGSLNRRNRVERWVKNVATPQTDGAHPVAMAAMMMGLPFPVGMGMEGGDDSDMLGFFDIDPDDPDLDDLREEFKPNLKGRLQGWVDVAMSIKGGAVVLLKWYGELIEDMPYLGSSDIVGEMSSRLSNRPSKHHVCDGLEGFRDFCKKQKKRMFLNARKEAQAKAPSEQTDLKTLLFTTDTLDAASHSGPAGAVIADDID